MLSNWWYTMLYSNRRTRADPSRAASQPGTRKLVYANLFAIRQHRGLNSWIVGRVRTLDWLFAFINNASEFINNESAATRRSTWHTENSFLDVRHLGIIRRLLQQEMTDHVGHSSAMRTNGVGAGPENAINNFFLCCLTCTLQAAVWLTKTENIERGHEMPHDARTSGLIGCCIPSVAAPRNDLRNAVMPSLAYPGNKCDVNGQRTWGSAINFENRKGLKLTCVNWSCLAIAKKRKCCKAKSSISWQ